jgi:hypothetical protein
MATYKSQVASSALWDERQATPKCKEIDFGMSVARSKHTSEYNAGNPVQA